MIDVLLFRLYLIKLARRCHRSTLPVGLCFILLLQVSCHRYDLVPRDIEIIQEHFSMGYVARNRYQRALNQLNGAGVVVGHPLHQQVMRVNISGEVRSLADDSYFVMIPRSIVIAHNQCRIIQLLNKKKTQVTPLQICYANKELYVDPDPMDEIEPFQSSIFYPSPLWKLGSPMPGISTCGLASLRDAEIRIQYVDAGSKEVDEPISS